MAKVPVEIFVDPYGEPGNRTQVTFCCRAVLKRIDPKTLISEEEVIETCGPTIDSASRRLQREVNDWVKRHDNG